MIESPPTPPPDLCILIATCTAYRPLAELTGRILDRHWAAHPPAFFCGADHPSDEHWLPLSDDPSDWIGIVLRATRALRERGFRQAYLILEDHLPLFRCHARHLNSSIPELLTRLRAAQIGLKPWGTGEPYTVSGQMNDYIWLEHLPPGFLWKFQLHPTLWSLEALETILAALAATLPLDRRSPWAFERQAGRVEAPPPEDLKSFRLVGERPTAGALRRELVRLERRAVRVVRFLAGRVAGDRAWRWTDTVVGQSLRYYDGPYPHFLSGVLLRGRPNENCLRFLALHGHHHLVRELRDTIAGMAQPGPRPRHDGIG